MSGPAYKPLRYSDVAEKLERAVKEPEVVGLGSAQAAEYLTMLLRIPVSVAWLRVARGEAPRV